MISNRLIIGKITAAHGIRGEVKVFPITDDARRFLKLKNAFFCDENANNEIPCEVASSRMDRGNVLLKFKDYPDRTAAETLKGKFLSVDRENAVALKKDSFFISDMKDLEVIDDTHNSLGHVKEVMDTGAQHIVVIKRDGKKDLLVPFVKQIFYDVQIEQGFMKCNLPAGLYELYDV